MQKIIVMLGLLGGVIFLSPMDANAAECQHFYRMSGRCADAQGHKVYGNAVHHPVKQKKPQAN